MTARTLLDLGHPGRACRMAGALIGVALSLGGCLHTEAETQASIPADYRLRHPIAVEEANQSIVVFVGQGRGDKILVFHLKRKKQYKKMQGHRQNFTEVRIKAIVADGVTYTAK